MRKRAIFWPGLAAAGLIVSVLWGSALGATATGPAAVPPRPLSFDTPTVFSTHYGNVTRNYLTIGGTHAAGVHPNTVTISAPGAATVALRFTYTFKTVALKRGDTTPYQVVTIVASVPLSFVKAAVGEVPTATLTYHLKGVRDTFTSEVQEITGDVSAADEWSLG